MYRKRQIIRHPLSTIPCVRLIMSLRVFSKKVVGTNQLEMSLGRELLGLETLSLRGQGSGECRDVSRRRLLVEEEDVSMRS